MILDKVLLLKGLGGLTACAAVACTGTYIARPDLFESNDQTLVDLISKVGLTGCTNVNKECAIKTEGISVKQGESKETSKTKQTGSTGTPGKIKVYKDNSTTDYNEGFKFVIEDGDITLTGGSGSTTISKLEQFETYEIKEEGAEGQDKKWYFSRKKKAGENIKESLGLPDGCTLEDNVNCSEVTVDSNNIKKIKFDGISGESYPSINGNAKLTVTKETTDIDFPYKFKFSFKASDSSSTITLSSSKTISLKTDKGTEFKIKKSGNTLSLEEAWTLNKLLEKVGLSDCTTSSPECTINASLKVKQNDKKDESKTKDTTNTGSGKIKLSSSNDTDYEYGFKFVIEDGDINLTGGTESSITKLEQFETYEIKKETSGTNWYLTRKKDALEEKRRILGLPASNSDCKLPENNSDTKTCSNITEEQLKAINFKDKGDNEPTIESSGSVTLTITKISDSPFNDEGYKFSFNPTQDVTISTSSSIKIAKNSGTEFKITKEGNSLSLEKAWTVATLGAKVGLTCPAEGSNNECTLSTDNTLKLYVSENDKTENGQVSDNSKKIKYEENAADHNQGFKFYAEEEITLSGENNSNKKIEASTAATYEIKPHTSGSSTTWYLTKKTTSGGG